jgi:UDP:flavonoid glycosyltransferase YjiC (YdhE family)
VDLFITHGGNNSTTESFHFGKPMIVMPLFMDQFDNAQRVAEKGYGVRLNPFHCEKDELLRAVDTLLADSELTERMKLIGERIRCARNNERAAELILSKIE